MSGLFLRDWLDAEPVYLGIIKFHLTEHVAWTLTTLPAYRDWLTSDLRRKIMNDIEDARALHYPKRAAALLELLADLNRMAPEENDDEC